MKYEFIKNYFVHKFSSKTFLRSSSYPSYCCVYALCYRFYYKIYLHAIYFMSVQARENTSFIHNIYIENYDSLWWWLYLVLSFLLISLLRCAHRSNDDNMNVQFIDDFMTTKYIKQTTLNTIAIILAQLCIKK